MPTSLPIIVVYYVIETNIITNSSAYEYKMIPVSEWMSFGLNMANKKLAIITNLFLNLAKHPYNLNIGSHCFLACSSCCNSATH